MLPESHATFYHIPLIPAVLAGMRGKNPKSVVFGFFRCAAAAVLASFPPITQA